ncbi:class I SAM-dependent methyltransferase [Acidibrevibacterium fodinaquatile]|uniref:class I SAM-dependent methyltransferase n=1 Tax=Acidibrevibacterium fodinaquatile TaxID=1969806 RepID=UPI000E0DE795|nr:class I SAM-dependent methyltransferase [Acidibrevibacterium fodinaquatile]
MKSDNLLGSMGNLKMKKVSGHKKHFVDRVVRGKLTDMSEIFGEKFAGIFIPADDVGAAKIGITKQFLQDASVYHERYSATPYFRWLLEGAVKGRMAREPAMILDIGSGSGNSVLPALDLFPKTKIVATDLSEDLLAILRDHLAKDPTQAARVSLACLDATRADYIEGSADLVIGAAVLHHLLDPAECVRRAIKALSPKGTAIFFEPFEAGNAVLRLAYECILSRNADGATEPLSTQAIHVLRALVQDYSVRAGSDKSAPIFRDIDDKWLFTHAFFKELIAPLGDYDLEIEPINLSDDCFTRQTRTNFRLALGVTEDVAIQTLPEWAWDILKRADQSFSFELKKDLPIEARIIIRRKP